MLMAFSWPGNVRQLEQALFAAAALWEGDEITPSNSPAWFHEAITSEAKPKMTYRPQSYPPDQEPGPVKDPQFSKDEELKRYLDALQATKYPGTGRWNVSAAARRLGVPVETLIYHLKNNWAFPDDVFGVGTTYESSQCIMTIERYIIHRRIYRQKGFQSRTWTRP